jgi:hypothetical protein
MADPLPITGKDVSVEVVVNGVPLKLTSKVVSYNEDEVADMVESEHLGTDNVQVKKLPKGWRGEMTVSRKDGNLDDFVDAYNLALRNNVPVVIMITRVQRYNDGTSRTHVYPEVTIAGLSTNAQRGQNVTSRLPWRCGVERI